MLDLRNALPIPAQQQELCTLPAGVSTYDSYAPLIISLPRLRLSEKPRRKG